MSTISCSGGTDLAAGLRFRWRVTRPVVSRARTPSELAHKSSAPAAVLPATVGKTFDLDKPPLDPPRVIGADEGVAISTPMVRSNFGDGDEVASGSCLVWFNKVDHDARQMMPEDWARHVVTEGVAGSNEERFDLDGALARFLVCHFEYGVGSEEGGDLLVAALIDQAHIANEQLSDRFSLDYLRFQHVPLLGLRLPHDCICSNYDTSSFVHSKVDRGGRLCS